MEHTTAVTSLDDYEVQIDDRVRQMLTDQLLASHNNDCDAARQHMNEILLALKTPPTTSYGRIDNCYMPLHETTPSSLEAAMENLRHHLHKNWPHGMVILEPHAKYYDVIQIRVDYAKSNARCLSSNSEPIRLPDDKILFSNWPRRHAMGWPMTHRIVLCDRFCAEAVLRGSHIFVPGILSQNTGIEKGEIVAVYGYMGTDSNKPTLGSSFSQVCQKLKGTCVFLGMGRACWDPLQLSYIPNSCSNKNSRSGVAISMTKERAGAILPPLHDLGKFGMTFQNLPSMIVGHALDPQQGEVILDMCCAPGGKTTHLASLVRGKATIVACDKSRAKMLRLLDLINTTGKKGCIIPLVLDGTKCVNVTTVQSVEEIIAKASRSDDGLLDIHAFRPESFDRILLDPPCSALGVRPKLAIPITARELVKTAQYQREFLGQAIQLLKPGGIMTYSTCTINALENECNVAYVLNEYSNVMRLLPLPLDKPGHAGLPGHGLSGEQLQRVKRFDPSNRQDDCMGFFIAKFQKKVA